MVTPIYFLNTINDAAALLLARGADFLSAFDKPQRDALVMVFLRMHGQGILANELFWGFWLFPFGLLVYRSRFLPCIPRRLADAQLLRLSGHERHRHIMAAMRTEGLQLGFPGDVRRTRHHAVAHRHGCEGAAAPGVRRLILGISSDTERHTFRRSCPKERLRVTCAKDYAYLNATIGSTRMARRAGMEHAAIATASNRRATLKNVSQSPGLTP
jgi:hypothetical protein